MQQDNSRNTIIFVVLTLAILIVYQVLVLDPAAKRRKAALQEKEKAAATQTVQGRPAAPMGPVFVEPAQALASAPRVLIDTPALKGSLSLKGGRVDDLKLKRYHVTPDESSALVDLFRPAGVRGAWFAEFGWYGQNVPGLPGPDTVWTLVSGTTLAPGRPVVLRHDSPSGLSFTRAIAVDENYMFTVSDTVANRGAAPLTLRPYSSVQRHGIPTETHNGKSVELGKNQIIHEGAIGVFNGKTLKQSKYGKWRKGENRNARFDTTGGWVGITDKYWLAAVIPAQNEAGEGAFRVVGSGQSMVHETVFSGQPVTIAPGRQTTETTRLFAGAKREEILSGYQKALGIPRFDDSIDWGMFWFLTRPIFAVLEFFYKLVGNFGVAILLLTVAVKAVLFPLANKAFESMSKMKKLQPKMEEIKKKHGADPQKQQQEMMALYAREKLNPLAGCLPIFVQIPVWYALYKVLSVTIEMRHAPFFGWMQDLSERDPTTMWNLFGLIPWNPATTPMIGGLLDGVLHLGVLPLLYGFTMWLQQAMNPPPADPIQRQMFAFFPVIFTFIMAPFASGLILYWVWNNVLSIAQQYVIMRRFGAENPIDDMIARLRGREKAA